MPLSITVVAGSPTPIYRQVFDQIATAILSGRLAEGEALPSVRAMSEELVLNPNTVARAYSELARDGFIESRGTVGSFVLPRRQKFTRAERRRRFEPTLKAFVAEALVLGYEADEIMEQVEEMIEALTRNRTGKPKGDSR